MDCKLIGFCRAATYHPDFFNWKIPLRCIGINPVAVLHCKMQVIIPMVKSFCSNKYFLQIKQDENRVFLLAQLLLPQTTNLFINPVEKFNPFFFSGAADLDTFLHLFLKVRFILRTKASM